MAEVQFAKSYLATLDRRPVKLSSDFVSDPKKYPSQSPYTLPRPTHPFPTRAPSTTSTSNISITLTPTKPTHPSLTLPSLPSALTTILDLKTQYAQHASLPVSAVKILHAKRPAADLKTLKDLLPSPTPPDAELGVMVLAHVPSAAGGVESSPTPPVVAPSAFAPPPKDKVEQQHSAPLSEEAKAVAGEEAVGKPAVRDERFWGDLKDFLVQRLRDEGEGERLLGVFRTAAGDA
ncbi:hypothetical protein K461DRAFT_290200 [Myriangium duriaei CBS 260.36]|uniref:Ubiquitin-like domain-containing protein n=1 Tax=Myriangium duriaei CBS 260.36 TaxID=1168546 RepID=A0A9P4JF99_9PEZI|nr:hypothetical protein K461DRAFT_290200 [Myriangium duriaei CBS 260.36]